MRIKEIKLARLLLNEQLLKPCCRVWQGEIFCQVGQAGAEAAEQIAECLGWQVEQNEGAYRVYEPTRKVRIDRYEGFRAC